MHERTIDRIRFQREPLPAWAVCIGIVAANLLLWIAVYAIAKVIFRI